MKHIYLFCVAVFLLHCDNPRPESFRQAGGETVGIDLIAPATLTQGESARLVVVALFADGTRCTVDPLLHLYGDDAASLNGVTLTALHEGFVRISAEYCGFSDEERLDIVSRPNYSQVKLYRIFSDAIGSDTDREYFTIKNFSEKECAIAGAYVSRPGYRWNLPDITLAPAEEVCFCQAEEGYAGNDIRVFSGLSFSMRNAAETLRISFPDGSEDVVYIGGGNDEFAPESWGSSTLPFVSEGNVLSRTSEIDTDTYADWSEI